MLTEPPKLPSVWFRGTVSWQTIILVGTACAVTAFLFVFLGVFDIYADRPDSRVFYGFMHFAFGRAVGSSAHGIVPPDDLGAPGRIKLGAQHYASVCANCHGGPGIGQSVTALSMSPRPQSLPKVVSEFTDSELYVIVMRGVAFSAMPAWANDAREDEVWSMVAFLRQLPKMDTKTYYSLTAAPKQIAGSPLTPDDAVPVSQPANALKNTYPTDQYQYSAPAIGFGDTTLQTNPALTCARCHGADGTGNVTGGEAPNLTIHDAGYLRTSLQSYISGERKSGYMQTVAAHLSADQVTALADYYAALPVKKSPPASISDAALVKRGETIATAGIPQSATPACANCHEGAGRSVVGAPTIAGQSQIYLQRQLAAMRRGGRGGAGTWKPMSAVAQDLSDEDIAALAAYYAAKSPAKAQPLAEVATLAPIVGHANVESIFLNTCVKCHENLGRGGNEGVRPDLTLLDSHYVANTLYEFRARKRPSGKMLEVTQNLSDDEIASLANFIDSLKPESAIVQPNRQAAKNGAQMAEHGAPDRGIPACMSCHDEKATKAVPLIPPLQGQSVVYLAGKLDEFASRDGQNQSALNPMPSIARSLNQQERHDLADYFAAATPLSK